jgi:hypothetical protein
MNIQEFCVKLGQVCGKSTQMIELIEKGSFSELTENDEWDLRNHIKSQNSILMHIAQHCYSDFVNEGAKMEEKDE